MRSRRDLATCALLIAVGVWVVFMWMLTPGRPAFDIYSYYVPNMLYAVQRVAAGGAGLFWNPFQNCGQPSFGIGSTGPLYPASVLFHFLDSNSALRAVIMFNLIVAGLGMYAFARELGSGRAAAYCAAVAFELGPGSITLDTWSPMVSSPYAWTPVAMLFCERLLRAPSFGGAVGLGVSVTLALLSGFPQWVYLLYQLIGLRIVFEFATRRVAAPWRVLIALGAGLLLGPLLDAVQLVPSVEAAALSVRGGALKTQEMLGQGVLSWDSLRESFGKRLDIFNPIIVLPLMVAAAGWLRQATRRTAVFYAGAGIVYLLLGFGPRTPLFALYTALPFGTLFREPARLTWMTSFCVAVLVGYGTDALIRLPRSAPWRHRALPAGCAAATLLALHLYSPSGLRPLEWVLGAAVVAAPFAAGWTAHGRRIAGAMVAAAVSLHLASFPWPVAPKAVNQFAARQFPLRVLLRDDAVLFKYGDQLSALREQMSPQERIFFLHSLRDFSLISKLASLYELPTIDDYEPQPSRRIAEYLVMIRTARPMTTLNQYYYPGSLGFTGSFRKRLLDLAAVRYLIVGADVDQSRTVRPPLKHLRTSDDRKMAIYENLQAMPRARFVPGLEVVEDPAKLLKRLAYGSDDLSRIAFVEELPPGGFLGDVELPADASVEFLTDDPERVVIRVTAPDRGYLFLADQWFPGWYATVDGEPAQILRANFLFRAVEVPEGESTVEFRYAPTSLRVGASISLVSIAGLIVAVVLRRRRGRPSRQPSPEDS